ncbi:hypothetical protein CRG98_039137 [Punica granatum]|uniref:Uncharacterized protein n=1 Tax=Punica granatum TaxID=22663 RepID=A0A2I0I937_PUNGR|nr:hypothetical protein CRG98_039137 [Punica granatum]
MAQFRLHKQKAALCPALENSRAERCAPFSSIHPPVLSLPLFPHSRRPLTTCHCWLLQLLRSSRFCSRSVNCPTEAIEGNPVICGH